MSSVNLAPIAALLGDYCREKADDLKMVQVLSGMQSVNKLGIPLETGIRDEQEYVIPYINEILQKGNAGSFNAVNNAIDFVPRRWKVRPFKADIVITPQDFNATFLAAYNSPSRNPYGLTLIEMMFDMIMRRKDTDLEKVVWQGVYSAAANPANTANVLAIADGFKQHIAAAILATDTTPVATGAVNATNAVTKFEQMWEALPEELKFLPSVIYCSPQQATNYYKHYRVLYPNSTPNFVDLYAEMMTARGNTDPDFTRAFTLDIAGGNCIVMPAIGLSGSNRLIIESRPMGFAQGGMLGIGISDQADMLNMQVEYHLRDIYIMIDGAIGTQISAFDIGGSSYVLVNDQA